MFTWWSYALFLLCTSVFLQNHPYQVLLFSIACPTKHGGVDAVGNVVSKHNNNDMCYKLIAGSIAKDSLVITTIAFIFVAVTFSWIYDFDYFVGFVFIDFYLTIGKQMQVCCLIDPEKKCFYCNWFYQNIHNNRYSEWNETVISWKGLS